MKTLVCKASSLRVRSRPNGDDTGKRILSGQEVNAYGESFEHDWVFVETKNIAGWVSAQYLAPVVPHASNFPAVPNGLAELKRLYGEPGTPVCHAGRVHLPHPLPLSWAPSESITVIACHKLVEAPAQAVFNAIEARGIWSLLHDYGGCYEYRKKRGTTAKVSTHAWGIAFDINPIEFPLASKKKQDRRLVEVFAEFGFLNGEGWARPDPMHFQRVTGY